MEQKPWFNRKKAWKIFNKIKDSALFAILLIFGLRTFLFDWSVVPSGSMSHKFLVGDVVLFKKWSYGRYSLHSIPVLGSLPYLGKIMHRALEQSICRHLVTGLNVDRGDVIVFASHDSYITKRVLGLPGDLVEWDNYDVRINGVSTLYKKNETESPGDKNLIGAKSVDYLLGRTYSENGKDKAMQEFDSFLPRKDGSFLKHKIIINKNEPNGTQYSYKVPPGHVMVIGDNRPYTASFDTRTYYFLPVAMNRIIGKAYWRIMGSNSKVFSRQRSLIMNIIMFPYLVLKYIIGLNVFRFGPVTRAEDFISAEQMAKLISSNPSQVNLPIK